MIIPQTTSEQLIFSTVRIEVNSNVGTGFFFSFQLDEHRRLPVIITNKHVVNDSEVVSFSLHEGVNKNKKLLPSGKFTRVNYKTNWVNHPGLDLCATLAQPLINQVESKHGKKVFYITLNENLVWDDKKLEGLSAVEDVLMIGYPIGLWDDENNLPLVRKGITSTHPAIDFKGKSVGVIDIACFHGSSGSPVLIVNEGMYGTKKGTSIGSRAILLGVLFSGPTYNTEGDIVIKDIPTVSKVVSINKTMINLGLYIKSKEILKLGKVIKKSIGLDKKSLSGLKN